MPQQDDDQSMPPFRAIVEASASQGSADLTPGGEAGDTADGDWSVDEIEAAYQRALEMAESLESAFPDEPVAPPESVIEDERPVAVPEEAAAVHSESADAEETVPQHVGDGAVEGESSATEQLRVTAPQILEALLFVGGRELTTKQMAECLGGSTTPELVEEMLQERNAMYIAQQRPYEIRLVEGGYRLSLRQDFERIRDRVYGAGPREVRLSQDALEILAFVAYQQPVTADDIDACGKTGSGGLLRQLLRRELIALQKDESGTKQYTTTPRFLELFGLSSLRDLPRVESVGLR